MAILRYRLWDVDVLLSRALVYGALTAGVIVLYVVVVGYLGAVFHTIDNLALSLVATGVVAALFEFPTCDVTRSEERRHWSASRNLARPGDQFTGPPPILAALHVGPSGFVAYKDLGSVLGCFRPQPGHGREPCSEQMDCFTRILRLQPQSGVRLVCVCGDELLSSCAIENEADFEQAGEDLRAFLMRLV